MAVPSYTTDLTTINLATGAWVELTGATAGSAPGSGDIDNFIAGTDSVTEAVRSAGLCSMASPTVTQTITAGDAAFMWLYFSSMPALATFANNGYEVAIGSTTANYNKWRVFGSDTKPYGGWISVAVDPTTTPTATVGTPTTTTAVFGSVINLLNGISKGNAFANDYQRKGRSLIVTAGDITTPGTFSGSAAVNDLVTNRWGLCAVVDGGFSQKGAYKMGSVGTAVYFSDRNKNIIIEDTLHVAAGFNEFQVLNAGSTVIWDGVQITALGTVSRGKFTVTDNASVTLVNCNFIDMDTFSFLSNTTTSNTTFRRTGLITIGGSTFTDNVIVNNRNTISVTTANLSLISACEFISDDLNHAIEITAAGEYSLTDNIFTNYATTNGTTGNEVIYNNSGGNVIINVSGGSGTVSYRNVGVSTTTINNTIAVTLTGLKELTEVRVLAHGTNTELAGIEVATDGITDNRSFTFSLSASTAVDIIIHSLVYVHLRVENYIVPSLAATLPIAQQIDRNYLNV